MSLPLGHPVIYSKQIYIQNYLDLVGLQYICRVLYTNIGKMYTYILKVCVRYPKKLYYILLGKVHGHGQVIPSITKYMNTKMNK